ncbi:acetyl-CoA carboxylase biotin carboxylase subunit family protein [Francisella sp. SYW-9]|uniref:ATP-grasp domain-containing protein n=1 Tax=Francisella sp. SYW-9 TaxID=2610888 RepID=UPI00123CC513|nr:ATP-grasp domain-containing protein [Francisella sp. SYW-9]
MKNIVIFASKPQHVPDISCIPRNIRRKANIILLINKNLENVISNSQIIFDEVIELGVKVFNNGVIVILNPEEVDSNLKLLENRYTSLEIVLPDEFNIDSLESILAKYNQKWSKGTGRICRDKILMKDFMQKHNIRTPKYIRFNMKDNFDEIKKYIGAPFIIKPIDSAGSIDVAKIATEEELNAFKRNKYGSKNFEVEEFIDGDLFHIETVKLGDKMFSTISEYTIPSGVGLEKNIITGSVNLDKYDKRYSLLNSFNNDIIKALDNDGCFHAEVFIDKHTKTPVFLEVAWRQAGYPVDMSFVNIHGYNQTLFYVCLLIDEGFENKKKDFLLFNFVITVKKGINDFYKLPAFKGDLINYKEIIKPDSFRENGPSFFADAARSFTLKYESDDDFPSFIDSDFKKIQNMNNRILNEK